MKNKIYVFTTNNCRVFKFQDESEIEHLKALPHLINPKVDHVIGTKPHHYRIKDGQIESISGPEMVLRDQQIAREGIDSRMPEKSRMPVKVPVKVKAHRFAVRVMTLHPYWVFSSGLFFGASLMWVTLH